MNPKTDPAFPCGPDEETPRGQGMGDAVKAFREWQVARRGLTQYAEVAARFHAALITSANSQPSYPNPEPSAREAFLQADAFFAELAKRTKS